ncbi:DNA-binding NarL/FixJ family response regulator [Collimonas sp. PA-H2]|nr:DNA-binding NarL/FixJ family response regulator [Collimonas sp. PA-H2]
MYIAIISHDPLLVLGLSTLIEKNFPVCEIIRETSIQETLKQWGEKDRSLATLTESHLLLIEQPNLESLIAYQTGGQTDAIPATIVFGVDNQKTIDLCRRHNVNDFVFKNDHARRMVETIQTLISNIPRARKCLLQKPTQPFSYLTARQKDLIDLLLQGYSNKKIAHALNLSYGTVKNYMSTLMQMMSARSRLEMAMKLRENGYQIRDVVITKSD